MQNICRYPKLSRKRNPIRRPNKGEKSEFENALKDFICPLTKYVSTQDSQWTIKGFIDTFRNVYTISSDTKIVSKILEIHLSPKILTFADKHDFALVLAEQQNYYPDISFVSKREEAIKFAVDFKTTYRLPDKPCLCNGFTLGFHGKYFQDRTSTKNIQFPYDSYLGHFCLGVIYDRTKRVTLDETKPHLIENLHSITSVISNIQFFVA